MTFNLFRSKGTLSEKPDGSERTFQHPPGVKIPGIPEEIGSAGPKPTKVAKPPQTHRVKAVPKTSEIHGTTPSEIYGEIGGPSNYSLGRLIAGDLTYPTPRGPAFCRDDLHSLKKYHPEVWAMLPPDLQRNLEANQEGRSMFSDICSNSKTQVQVTSGAFVHANEYVGEQKYVMAQYPMDHEAYWEHVFDEMSGDNHCVLVNLAAEGDILGTSERGYIDRCGNASVQGGPSRFGRARGLDRQGRPFIYALETKEQNYFWPRVEKQTRIYGSYTVENIGKRLVKEEGGHYYEVVDLKLTDAKGNERTLKMIDCPSWKDFSGTDDAMVMDLLREVHSEIEAHKAHKAHKAQKAQKAQHTTIKVNCQAGVGRTGEFVALLDQGLKMKKAVREGKSELDFSAHDPRAVAYQVREMRFARGSSGVVQTPEQFKQLCRLVKGMFEDYSKGIDPLAKVEEKKGSAPASTLSPVEKATPLSAEQAFDAFKKLSSEFHEPKYDKLLMEDSVPIGSWYLRRDGDALTYVCKELDINGRVNIREKRIQRSDPDLPKTVGELREKFDPEKQVSDEKIRSLWRSYSALSPKEKTLKEFANFIATKEISTSDKGLPSVKPGISRTIILPDEDCHYDYQVITISRGARSTGDTYSYGYVTVGSNGKITYSTTGARNRSFDTFEAFQRALDVKQPLSTKEFERLNTHNQFAHAWGLSGFVDRGDGIGFDKEGSYHEISAQTLMDQLDDLEFPSGVDNYFNEPEVKEAMRRALEDCIELRHLRFEKGKRATADKLIELIRASDAKDTPVLIPTGYSGHAVYMTYYRGVLAITNRGARHSSNRSGTHYFKVDPDVLMRNLEDKAFAKKFLGHRINSDTFKAFQPYENRWAASGYRGEMMSALRLTPLGVDKKAGQKVGNCTFANCIASMHTIATLKSMKDRPLGRSTVISRADEYKVEYKAFTFAVRAKVLEKASTLAGLETSEFHDDFVDAYGKMGAKLKNYEERGSSKASIVPICEYYRAKVNGLTEGNPEVRKQVEFIEKVPLMHYPGMSREDAKAVLARMDVGSWLVKRSTERGQAVYKVCYKNDAGRIRFMGLPSKDMKTMEDFEKRFKKDKQVPTYALPENKQDMARLYLKAQELSVGKMSFTEAQLHLKKQGSGIWLVRESRTIRGLFVVEKVEESGHIISTRLDEEHLKELIGKFDDKYPKAKKAKIIEQQAIFAEIGSSDHVGRPNYHQGNLNLGSPRTTFKPTPSPSGPGFKPTPSPSGPRFKPTPSPSGPRLRPTPSSEWTYEKILDRKDALKVDKLVEIFAEIDQRESNKFEKDRVRGLINGLIYEKLYELKMPVGQITDEIRRVGRGTSGIDLLGILIANLPDKNFTLGDIEKVRSAVSSRRHNYADDLSGNLKWFIDQMAEMTAFRQAEITDRQMEEAMKDAPLGSWYPRHSSDPFWFVILVKEDKGVKRIRFTIPEFEERIQQFEKGTYKHDQVDTKIAGRFSLPEELQNRVEAVRIAANPDV